MGPLKAIADNQHVKYVIFGQIFTKRMSNREKKPTNAHNNTLKIEVGKFVLDGKKRYQHLPMFLPF